jgi:hypothetical protein
LRASGSIFFLPVVRTRARGKEIVMTDFTPRLPARPSLEQLQKQAKELLRQHRASNPAAADRFRAANQHATGRRTLADAQFVVARECGFETWAKLKHYIDSWHRPDTEQYEHAARELLAACLGDTSALQRIHNLFGDAFTRSSTPFDTEQLRTYVHERLAAITGAAITGDLTISDIQLFLARQFGFADWKKFRAPASAPPFYRIDRKDNVIEPGPLLSDRDWDVVFAVMREQGITGLRAGGHMTDAALARLSKVDHVTLLDLGGSLQLTDDGLAHLAHMPQLQELDLSGWKGQLTDRGLEVLRHLPDLRRFQICWQQHVSDAGMAHLAACSRLESVNLLGTRAGDGAIRALGGKPQLRKLNTGSAVTDAGIPLLHHIPALQTWQGGDLDYGLMTFQSGPTHLVLDGPFTNAGLASLAGLNGLFGLTFFWHCPAFTAAGLAPLKDLSNLGFLGCQNERCDDEAMSYIAAIPRLRQLMGQGAVAGDAGFAALSRSPTLEYFWGRDCPNFTGRGLLAMSAIPSLRGLAVSFKNVDDEALSVLPRFPGLCELVPMDVLNAGFRHVGRCERLESLWCMYCRETGDEATAHIAVLGLKLYYAGMTRITDRSLETLGRMQSLERLEFWQCAGITNAGVAHLAGLPRLREIALDGCPGVTRDAVALFPPGVRVKRS